MNHQPLTPYEVSAQISELGRELDTTVNMLKSAEMDAVTKRHEADLAESRAYVRAEGSVELRKHTARIQCDRQEYEASVAEALVRHIRMQIRALETRIDIGRSLGTALRAELTTLNYEVHA